MTTADAIPAVPPRGLFRPDSDALLRLGAWLAVLLGSLLNLLNFNDYPLARGEVAIAALAVATIAAAMATLHRLAMPRLSFLFTGLLVALGIDLNSDQGLVALAAAVAATLIARFRDTAMLKLICAAFGAVCLAQAAQPLLGGPAAATPRAVAAARADAAGPVLLHVLFDGYLGIDGMRAAPESYAQLRRDNLAFYRDHGFRLYTGAYSDHGNTANSLPHIFSFGAAPFATAPQRLQRLTPGKLDYFTTLTRKGYRFDMLRPDYIDLCSGQAITECREFRRSNLSAIERTTLGAGERARLIGITLADMALVPRTVSAAGGQVWTMLGGEPMVDVDIRSKLFPIASTAELSALERRLARARPGDAFFAHLLMPHDPYVYDARCVVRPLAAWRYEGGRPRGERERAYADQMRCALRQLDGLLDALERSPGGREAIVIVHGDHGSRIVDQRPIAGQPQASARDLTMTYSTLFAIRAPAIAPGAVGGRRGVAALLGDFTRSDFGAAPAPGSDAAQVVLADDDWIPRRRIDLPPFAAPLTTY